MRMSALRLSALALPLVSLTAIWGWTEYQSRQGTDWEVPIQGYDPRDLLRGHYVQFNYDWPIAEDAVERFTGGSLYEFCIEGQAPKVERITTADTGPDGCENYVRSSESLVSGGRALREGRLYIPQDQGPQLEAKLSDPSLQGVVLFRLRDDGHITPLNLLFSPRAPSEEPPEGEGDADEVDAGRVFLEN